MDLNINCVIRIQYAVPKLELKLKLLYFVIYVIILFTKLHHHIFRCKFFADKKSCNSR